MLRHLPNLLSMLRLLAAVPLYLLIVADRNVEAFWLALVAGGSDGIDGWLARRYGWMSRFGAIVDPLADKALLLGALLALTRSGDLPLWLLALSLGRDLCIVLGGLVFDRRYERLTPQPSTAGKLATAALVLLTVAVLAARAYGWPPALLLDVLLWLNAGLIIYSWLDYWRIWQARSRAVLAARTREGGGS